MAAWDLGIIAVTEYPDGWVLTMRDHGSHWYDSRTQSFVRRPRRTPRRREQRRRPVQLTLF